MEKYFQILRKGWFGILIIYALVLLATFTAIKSFLIEPFDIAKEYKPGEVPPFFFKKVFWHIGLTLFIASYVTLIVDVIYKMINYKEEKLRTTKEKSNSLYQFVDILKEVGLSDVTSKLQNTKYEPKEVMAVSKKRLHFMGISGSKWINAEGGRFEAFLRRLDAANGKVRFLLLDPSSSGHEKLKTLRDGNIEEQENLLRKFDELSKKYRCLHIKLYSSLPGLRLISIDEKTIVISPYRLDKDGYLESNKGWDNPHIAFSTDAKWSFFNLFDSYFFNVWNSAKDLHEYISPAA